MGSPSFAAAAGARAGEDEREEAGGHRRRGRCRVLESAMNTRESRPRFNPHGPPRGARAGFARPRRPRLRARAGQRGRELRRYFVFLGGPAPGWRWTRRPIARIVGVREGRRANAADGVHVPQVVAQDSRRDSSSFKKSARAYLQAFDGSNEDAPLRDATGPWSMAGRQPRGRAAATRGAASPRALALSDWVRRPPSPAVTLDGGARSDWRPSSGAILAFEPDGRASCAPVFMRGT